MNDSFNGIVIEDQHHVDQPLELQNLRVTGNCYFTETVDVDRMEIDGVSKFRSFVTCDRLWVSGEVQMMQMLLTETLRVTGSLTVMGNCWADVAVFEGEGEFNSKFSAGRLLVKPSAAVNTAGRLKAERLTVQGMVRGTGKLSCREAEIMSCFPSFIHELVGDSVKVAYAVPSGQLEMNCTDYILTCSFMDVGKAVLEHTYVEQLFCDTAIIGAGCCIRELIYRDGVEIDSGAVVERLSKA